MSTDEDKLKIDINSVANAEAVVALVSSALAPLKHSSADRVFQIKLSIKEQ